MAPLITFMRAEGNRLHEGEAYLFAGSHGGRKLRYETDEWRKIVKNMLLTSGYSKQEVEKWSGHSFRAGGATDAFDAGIPWEMVVKQGRWRSDAWKVYRRASGNVVSVWAKWTPPATIATVSRDLTLGRPEET